MDRIIEKQERFIDHFIECGVGAKAARLAGYGKGEFVTACRLLKQPKIRKAIEQR